MYICSSWVPRAPGGEGARGADLGPKRRRNEGLRGRRAALTSHRPPSRAAPGPGRPGAAGHVTPLPPRPAPGPEVLGQYQGRGGRLCGKRPPGARGCGARTGPVLRRGADPARSARAGAEAVLPSRPRPPSTPPGPPADSSSLHSPPPLPPRRRPQPPRRQAARADGRQRGRPRTATAPQVCPGCERGLGRPARPCGAGPAAPRAARPAGMPGGRRAGRPAWRGVRVCACGGGVWIPRPGGRRPAAPAAGPAVLECVQWGGGV